MAGRLVISFCDLTWRAAYFRSLPFQGTFATEDQVALFNITANTAETITIETYSYAGGTVNSTVIPAGGFAPTAFFFINGAVITLSNGSCGQEERDPATPTIVPVPNGPTGVADATGAAGPTCQGPSGSRAPQPGATLI